MRYALIVAVNNDDILRSCLFRSPCLPAFADIQEMRGFPSAASAYNAGIRRAQGEILVFAHQDIYMPAGWDQCLRRAIDQLFQEDPRWAVMGIWGINTAAAPCGYVYCTGLQKVLGGFFSDPIPCLSLDEMVLVLRRSSELRFDEQLPGFHLYGTDLCLTARQHGFNSYLFCAFCIHNTDGRIFLPAVFWRGYFYLRRKWSKQLPIRTPCTRITSGAWPVMTSVISNFYTHYLRRLGPGRRVSDPSSLYTQITQEHAKAMPSTVPERI